MGALLGELLSGDLEGYGRTAQGTDMGGGSYTRDFERWTKEGSSLGNSKIC